MGCYQSFPNEYPHHPTLYRKNICLDYYGQDNEYVFGWCNTEWSDNIGEPLKKCPWCGGESAYSWTVDETPRSRESILLDISQQKRYSYYTTCGKRLRVMLLTTEIKKLVRGEFRDKLMNNPIEALCVGEGIMDSYYIHCFKNEAP
jgi:hypothetical protein